MDYREQRMVETLARPTSTDARSARKQSLPTPSLMRESILSARERKRRRAHLKVEIKEGTKVCDAPGCSRCVPAGFHSKTARLFFCSGTCRGRHSQMHGRINSKCAYCGTPIHCRPDRLAIRNFCCKAHAGLARTERTIRCRAGRFSKLFHEYARGFAKAHYKTRSRAVVRWRLLTFLEFLNARGFSTIRAVTPNTIAEFLEWGQSRGLDRPQLSDALGSISVFLNWATMAGRYRGMNPIQPRMHRLVKPERVPRPLTDQALAWIWRTLDEQGTLQQKLAVALGEEAGLRISEVCNLRISDIDMQGRRIFVRVPNKTDSERWALFHRKTRKLLGQWLNKRGLECGHDFLFLNNRNRPLTADRLAEQLRRVLAGRKLASSDRKQAGTADHFIFHRLRHTLASRLADKGLSPTVIMNLLGWKSCRMLLQYVHIHPQKVRELYEEAMA